jgi:hypothetical protein
VAQHTAARLQTATILHPGKHQALKLEVAEPVRAKVAEQALGDKPQQAQALPLVLRRETSVAAVVAVAVAVVAVAVAVAVVAVAMAVVVNLVIARLNNRSTDFLGHVGSLGYLPLQASGPCRSQPVSHLPLFWRWIDYPPSMRFLTISQRSP